MANITDLNDTCLQHIFSYLKLRDHLNLADSSTRLLPAARIAFEQKYGKKSVAVKTIESTDPKIEITENQIKPISFTSCLRFLRCFGPSISKIEILYWNLYNPRMRTELNRYISEHCATSVIEIEICYKDNHATLDLKSPLVKVEKVSFKNCSFGHGLLNLNKCFPNLRELEFYECEAADGFRGDHMPHLESLTIWNAEKGFGKENKMNLMRWNPQLKKLRIHWGVDLELIQFAGEHLVQLETLDITIERWSDQHTTDRIHFKNVKNFLFCIFCLVEVPYLPVSFDQLEEFTFTAPFLLCCVRYLINFIRSHRWITKFKYINEPKHFKPFGPDMYLNPQYALQTAKTLRSVTEFDLRPIYFDVNEAIDLVKLCPHLKCFQFKLSGRYSVLRERLGNEWRSTFDGYELVKLER